MPDQSGPFDFRELPDGLRRELSEAGSNLDLTRTQSGLIVPSHVVDTSPLDYMAVYLMSEEYLPEPAAVLRERCLRHWPRETLLQLLAIINNAFLLGRTGDLQDLFRRQLVLDSLSRFDLAMSKRNRSFLARQPILAAMKLVLHSEEPREPTREYPPVITAIVLTHAVASDLESEFSAADELVTGVPAEIGIELVRNTAFNEEPDVYTLVESYSSLWSQSGRRLSKVKLRSTPVELLLEATGLSPNDFLALGFALNTLPTLWRKLGDPFYPNNFDQAHPDPDVIDRFLSCVSFRLDEYPHGRGPTLAPWNFLFFEQQPVLRIADKLLVLDAFFLLYRITSGLYWFVHDHEQTRGDESARQMWSQAYGEMIEDHAEGVLRQLAPISLKGETVFTEDDFSAAFPAGKGRMAKACDAGIDFGVDFLLVEVQGKSLSVDTRIEGVIERFRDDTERLIIKKARQIDDVAGRLLGNEKLLTGCDAAPGRRIVPMVVVGGGYPITPSTLPYIREHLQAEGLLNHGQIEDLCVLSVLELYRLLSLHRQGAQAADVLRRWQGSDLKNLPFRVFADGQADLRALLDKDSDELEHPHPVLREVVKRLTLPQSG